jgi:ATP sulfurylase
MKLAEKVLGGIPLKEQANLNAEVASAAAEIKKLFEAKYPGLKSTKYNDDIIAGKAGWLREHKKHFAWSRRGNNPFVLRVEVETTGQVEGITIDVRWRHTYLVSEATSVEEVMKQMEKADPQMVAALNGK